MLARRWSRSNQGFSNVGVSEDGIVFSPNSCFLTHLSVFKISPVKRMLGGALLPPLSVSCELLASIYICPSSLVIAYPGEECCDGPWHVC